MKNYLSHDCVVLDENSTNMAEEANFLNVADNKNPLYALSQAQGETSVGPDNEAGFVGQHQRSDSGDTSSGSQNGATNSLTKPPGPAQQAPNSGSSSPATGNSSPENTMRSKDLRSSARMSMSEEGKDIQSAVICPKVNCPEKIVRIS